MKPQDHRESCIVTHDTPYEVAEGQAEGTHPSSGMLHRGRVVWIQRKLSDCHDEESIAAYAEGVGMISIDPKRLRQAR